MINKKNISELIAVILLLLVAVSIVISFQIWGVNFTSILYTNTEIKTNDINGLIIQELIEDELFISNNIEDELTIESLKIGDDDDCLRGTIVNLTIGINRVNVSGCSQNISDEIKEIVMVTKKGTVIKNNKKKSD